VPDWRKRLIRRNAWQLLACVPNVVEVMLHHEAWQGVIGFDEFSQRVVKRKRAPFEAAGPALPSDEWTDVDDTRAAVWIAQHERFVPNSAAVAEAVNVVARANPFHPVVDWLRTLQWDGTPRLDTWMVDLLHVADTEYVRRVSRYFLVGMVMRVLRPGVKFDYCLVLEGRQGRRKSTALRILGGEWFSDIELDLANKDSMSNIRGKWLHEFGEMGAIARTEATRQKSFLSRQVDEFRPSYGRREIRCPRQSAFGGTTNEWAWNKDPTGGRRFWPVEVLDEIDTDGLANVREQLFAEAYQVALAGERYWPDSEEQRTLFDDEQLAREAPEAYAEILSGWLNDSTWQGETFTLADAILSGLKVEAKSITRDIQTRVGIVLGKLGCERVERRNGPSRFVYKRPRRNAASSPATDAAGNAVEVPF
jgi:predicted P-loop ATPase